MCICLKVFQFRSVSFILTCTSLPAARPRDVCVQQACGKWARTLDRDTLVVTAASYVDRALSCGYTGLVLLHGVMSAAARGTADWTSTLLVNHHPSYYGMMVSSFLRHGVQQ